MMLRTKPNNKRYGLLVCAGLLCILVGIVGTRDLYAAQQEKVVKVVLINEEPYVDLYEDENGKVSGYSYSLLCELGQEAGYSYEFVFCNKAEAYQQLAEGSVDMACGLTAGDAQMGNLRVSELPVGWYPNVLYGMSTQMPEGGIVGTLTGNESQLSYTKMTFATREEALTALQDGTVQGVLLPGYHNPSGMVRIEKVDTEFFYLACSQEKTELMDTFDDALQTLLVNDGGLLEQLAVRYLYNDTTELFYLTQEERSWLLQFDEIDVLIDQDREVMQNMTDSLLQELANTLGIDLAMQGNQEKIQMMKQTIFACVVAGFSLCVVILVVIIVKKNDKIKYYQSQLDEKTEVLSEIAKEDGLRDLRYFTLDSLVERIQTGCLELERQFSANITIDKEYSYADKLVGDEDKIYQMLLGFVKEILRTHHNNAKVEITVHELPEMVIGRLDLEIHIRNNGIEEGSESSFGRRRLVERTTALGLLEILGGRLQTSSVKERKVQTITLAVEKKNYKEEEEERQREQQEKIRQAQREHLDEQRELYKSSVLGAAEKGLIDSLKGCRILLVDDDEMNRQLESVIMESAGAKVECASSGKEAIVRFKKSDIGYYDKIIMDIVMPEMDGYETVRQIRALQRRDAKTVRIVALSANAGNEDVKESIEAGMDAHCSKPINKGALFKALNS